MAEKEITTTGLLGWIDRRFPLSVGWQNHLSKYYAPKNFNFWYFFGSLALLILVIQILTGIFLTMHYKPDAKLAFASVEFIMRDVEWGWLIRYMHSTGASAFFIVIYLHMFRGLMYGSFKKPRELLWIFGMLIYVALMAEAFMGYLLPWGQMSYWGAQVIISLFGAIPYVGNELALWIRGDFVVSDPTLNRFFALHVIAMPLVLLGLVVVHVLALHEVGSNNPDGVEIKAHKDVRGVPLDGIPFHPYYTVKDIMGVVVFLGLYFAVVFFQPTFWGRFIEFDNFIPADSLKTPPHIAPVWYFTPFYMVLRSIPDKFLGVVAMGLSIFVLFVLPWLDRNPVKSIRYRSVLHKANIMVFVVVFVILGILGTRHPTPFLTEMGLRLSEVYFSFFLMLVFFSRMRPARTILAVYVVWMSAIMLYDLVRVSAETSHLVFTSLLIPGGYVSGLLLLALFFPWLATDKAVPERVR
ncbi:cytochrome B [Acidihalobacter yilgarnensis]|uniref:Cytochrome b n=1 Tax=Acidihalobacter yilgarnensis TaxID=2819280 RepID=A0A1D8IR44_9GAMM|nr:cytochrome bc complex cytochrome b subunit [Acidihalobacter yilgarnensis]AOU99018.1 cytochrome B [Acidihalobacter yilgarnensis]